MACISFIVGSWVVCGCLGTFVKKEERPQDNAIFGAEKLLISCLSATHPLPRNFSNGFLNMDRNLKVSVIQITQNATRV